MVEAAGKRSSMTLSRVHNDEIWKIHVRHENVSARHRWPETWGYLIYEYKKLNCMLAGAPVSPRPRSSKMAAPECLKLPTIPQKKVGFPTTTSQEIGWKSSKNGHNAQMVTNFGEQRRGKCTIQRRLKWPKMMF
ncbi:uncharacterized protein C20orf85-like [Mercenaria mercenaria]|uniref:uncharacterized protein C20orf85-like n=1 Tax=Mercenaria mercenaria TaxID=6596 RepID=UPI001E1E0D0D|nr:uncharacterized protein C20orf85-like [Mercenaria mercenaria]